MSDISSYHQREISRIGCADFVVDWDNLRVFLAVARAGQLLGAARVLKLNHATVARRLASLEVDMRSALVTRTTTGTVLTPEGERLLRHAEQIESEMIAATEDAGAANIAIEGTVRLGAPDGFGTGFLAGHIGELLERHPRLRIELVPLPRTFSLSRREADIAVTTERPREGRLVARLLCNYRLALYAGKKYLKIHGVPRELRDLAEHSLVGYVEDLIVSPSLDYTDEFLRGWRSSISIATAMGQTEAVRAGAGIGVLHTFIAAGDADLVQVLSPHTITRSYWCVVHEDLRTIRRVEVVADFLVELVSRERARFT